MQGFRPNLPCAAKPVSTFTFDWGLLHPSPLAPLLLALLLPNLLLLISLRRNSRLFKRQTWDGVSIRMNSSLLVLLLVFWTASFVTAAPNNGICYNKNMVQDPSQIACNPEAEASLCCSSDCFCLSNGLCQSKTPTQVYWTGTCTDYLWNSPSECPEVCNNDKTRQVASYYDVLLERIIPRMLNGKANFQISLSMLYIKFSISFTSLIRDE